MRNNGLIGMAVACVLAPIVVSAITGVVVEAADKAYKHIENVNYERRMKRGLKNGSVMIIDGEYCEIVISDVKGA